MKIGLTLAMLNPSLWTEATRLADALGYESVWMPEHLVIPVQLSGSPLDGEGHPPMPADVPVFEVFTYLGFLAGQTTRIRFGTYVYNIGLRHPLSTARAVATLDLLSQGRFEFGIGASWLRSEWDAVGLDFASRGRRVDEAVEVCRRLWSEDVVEHHGEFFDFEPVMFVPKPVQAPWPPLHFGGDGPAALRRSALLGNGWIPLNHTIDEIPAAAAAMARKRRDADMPGEVEISIAAPSAARDELRRLAESGVDRALVRPWTSAKDALDGIRRFADEVLPGISTYLPQSRRAT
jgi:probable F420-dependent oxidoreductase